MARGQAAIEFLMSYGYALLGLLVVFGVLVYFTGTYTGFLPSRCETGPQFICVEYKTAENGDVFLGVQNAVKDVDYVQLTLYCDADFSQARVYEHTGLLRVQDRLNGSLVTFSCPITGRLFKGEMHLVYRGLGEQTFHNTSGMVRMHVEK